MLILWLIECSGTGNKDKRRSFVRIRVLGIMSNSWKCAGVDGSKFGWAVHAIWRELGGRWGLGE